MYVFENNSNSSAAEMIKDYLEFRRDRENRLNTTKNISASSFENNQSDSFELFNAKPFFVKYESGYVRAKDNGHIGKFTEPTPNTKKALFNMSDGYDNKDAADENGLSAHDMIYIKQVSSDIAKKIQPIIENIVDEMEYEESPIYDDYIPKETIDIVLDRIYLSAISTLPELSDQTADTGNVTDGDYSQIYIWPKADITKELMRQLLFLEIFGRRRPYKRSLRDDYRYY